ncbi:methyltransferase [Gardnerella sp. KA01000]
MFMAWQDAIGGRLKSDNRFSNTVVWNNLPLPELTSDMRAKVIEAGKAVLKVRANHPGQSLADLYDPTYMPQDLRKAHDELDKIVDVAFGATKPCSNNDERLEILFKSYIRMTKE